jgi:xanthine/uracil permease
MSERALITLAVLVGLAVGVAIILATSYATFRVVASIVWVALVLTGLVGALRGARRRGQSSGGRWRS